MFICENCKDRLNVMDTPEGDRAFPAFAVLGGLVGTIAGAATGTILLVPAAVALGAVADMQRCGVCGEQAPGSSPGYRLMEELGGETGSRSYRPVGSPQGGKQPQGTGPAALRLAPAAPSPTRHFEEARPPGLSRQDDQAEDRPVYVFDEIEGGLVRQETNSEGAPADFDAPFAPEEGFGPPHHQYGHAGQAPVRARRRTHRGRAGQDRGSSRDGRVGLRGLRQAGSKGRRHKGAVRPVRPAVLRHL